MRRIGSKRKERKKQKRNQLVIGGILVLVLFASIFAYAFGGGKGSEENKVIYGGYEFIEKNGFWFTEVGNLKFSFRYNPNETEQINSNLNSLESYYDKPLYISSDDMESTSEIYQNLNSITQRMQLACLENEDGECENEDEDIPTKTCEDNFIIIREANVTEVSQENNCVFIKGKIEDLTKITDGFLLNIIGVQ